MSSNSPKTFTRASSVAVRGARYSTASWVKSGFGSAFLSNLPLELSGNVSIRMNSAGTM
ncbi:hypothetical protein MLGJGCBP_03110 [Rhodococcus sp. T7]|nr:hypothetical protein MLGJGCBP_03110 [Rhodococcus sp. T7]